MAQKNLKPIPVPAGRIRNFEEMAFGMFIHWGLYSRLGQGEWIMLMEKIPAAEYEKLVHSFTAARFDPELIASIARDAGMKYIVMTTRHHDGFSLYDLAAYNGKHNEANGEDNRDGTNDNNSWNCGYEGETGDPEINRLRRQMMKNYIAFLLISQGTPMLLGGDEFMRTQRGNNNSYCQDNDINYLDWDLMAKNRKLVDFTKNLIAYRRKRPHFRYKAFFTGLDTDGSHLRDINWYDVNLNAPNWNDGGARTIAFLIEGEEITEGRESIDVFVMINMFWGDIPFALPPCGKGDDWTTVMDTSLPDGSEFNGAAVMGSYNVRARSIVILERKK